MPNRLNGQPSVRSSAEAVTRLLIVADVRLYREGMCARLATRPQFLVVGDASSAGEAMRLTVETQADIVIVDMATKDSLAVIRLIRECAPKVHIIGFGVDEVEGEVLACAQAGLAGYIPCEASLDDLVNRVQSVQRGELLCTPRIAASLFRRLHSKGTTDSPQSESLSLSERERQVLKLIDRGLSNKEIARELHVEVSTVKHHVHNLLAKLQVSSRSQAVARLGTHVSTRRRGRAIPSTLNGE